MTVNEKKSPLKEKPLHYPGQSLDEKLDHIKKDMQPFILAPLLVVAVAALECWRWFTHSPPQPIAATVVAVVVGGYCIPKFLKLRKLHDNCELGRDGERQVGQGFEELRKEGYSVFHDLVANNFNVDHVIVSQRGIFAIETKTRTKREGNPKITFDGEKILMDGKSIDPNPVEQAKRNAKWLRDELHRRTNRWFPVKPVVVFPGWWVKEQNSRDVWVLNPEMLKFHIAREPEMLTKDDMLLLQTTVSWLVA
jgi:hypothetical protein